MHSIYPQLLRHTEPYRRCSVKCNITFAPNNVADEKCTSTSLCFGHGFMYLHTPSTALATFVIQDQTFRFHFFSPFMHRFRLMPSFCDRYRWFTVVCVPNSTISQSKSINNVKISRIWMEENPWAVISPRIFMQIYTYIYAQL